jgi:hypothetical protein
MIGAVLAAVVPHQQPDWASDFGNVTSLDLIPHQQPSAGENGPFE